MDIQALRQRDFPGSEIVIEKELKKGGNYRQYDAWYRSDGLKIYGLLTVPDAPPPAGGHPAIVFLHGYIEPSHYRTTELYLAHVDVLASNGYVVFKIDLRGHDRSEGNADGGYATPGYTLDVLNAVASLQRFSQVNPQKIGLWGHSMGGFLTLRAMVISTQIKVGVIWAGLVCSYPDMIYRWGNAGYPLSTPMALSDWEADWAMRYGTPVENPEFWASISATSFLKDLSGPLQLHHGTADPVVPVAFSEELATAIQRAGGKTELFTYPGEDHNLVKSFNSAMIRSLQFFNQALKR
jgi:dipeptidyl aminopeptidase/acylaminoacyl peptidase